MTELMLVLALFPRYFAVGEHTVGGQARKRSRSDALFPIVFDKMTLAPLNMKTTIAGLPPPRLTNTNFRRSTLSGLALFASVFGARRPCPKKVRSMFAGNRLLPGEAYQW